MRRWGRCTGVSRRRQVDEAMIVCKSPAELERMRAANALVAKVLEELQAMVAPGATTNELEHGG